MLVSIRGSVLRFALVLLRCEVVFFFTAAPRETRCVVGTVVVVCGRV